MRHSTPLHRGSHQWACGREAVAYPHANQGQGDDRRRRQKAAGASLRHRSEIHGQVGVLYL